MNLEEIQTGLLSDLPEDQGAAMEKARLLCEQIVEDAVEALKRGPHRFIVAERLGWLGSLCLKPLRKIVEGPIDASGEVEILASLVMLRFGEMQGVGHLLKAIESGSEYSSLAAIRLSKLNVVGAKESILKRLESPSLENEDEIAALVFSLRDVGGELPQDLETKFKESAATSWKLKPLWPEEQMPVT